MSEFVSPALAAWQSFYFMLGSSAAALIGIQFVVLTLIANLRRPTTADAISAFGTPTVVQLASTLLVSAIMMAPWPSLFPTSIALAMCGFGGLAYGAIIIRRARRQTYYKPEWQDWLWYALWPCGVFATLTLAAFFLRTATLPAMFVIGAAALGLLLIGIHNAWDTVTHIVAGKMHSEATMDD